MLDAVSGVDLLLDEKLIESLNPPPPIPELLDRYRSPVARRAVMCAVAGATAPRRVDPSLFEDYVEKLNVLIPPGRIFRKEHYGVFLDAVDTIVETWRCDRSCVWAGYLLFLSATVEPPSMPYQAKRNAGPEDNAFCFATGGSPDVNCRRLSHLWLDVSPWLLDKYRSVLQRKTSGWRRDHAAWVGDGITFPRVVRPTVARRFIGHMKSGSVESWYRFGDLPFLGGYLEDSDPAFMAELLSLPPEQSRHFYPMLPLGTEMKKLRIIDDSDPDQGSWRLVSYT